ncbi:Uncharacterized protein FKW44_006572 [Caligus rogercresseyi]|uniref:Uncharacterized protein n=1 Tax=Caligus rogercresseyi TaxID=217165 RepID=A0A7T8KDJ9_CALRO|nr:Uncharacterized protein FKW44_006572 [Caligus rogercresseyi]
MYETKSIAYFHESGLTPGIFNSSTAIELLQISIGRKSRLVSGPFLDIFDPIMAFAFESAK